MRRFTIIAAIIVIAMLVLANLAPIGRASRTEAAFASVNDGPSSDWSISGQIQEMNGNFWVIQGFSIRVNDDTRVSGVIPTIGAFAAAEGIVQADATWLATRIRVSDRDDFTPTPVDTATVTATSSETVTSTPTPTSTTTVVGTVSQTPTPTPTPTSTRVATSTKVSDDDDQNDDGDRNDNEDTDDNDGKTDKSAKPPHTHSENNGKHLGNGHGNGIQNGQGKGSKGERGD
jgi:hypothetical protein